MLDGLERKFQLFSKGQPSSLFIFKHPLLNGSTVLNIEIYILLYESMITICQCARLILMTLLILVLISPSQEAQKKYYKNILSHKLRERDRTNRCKEGGRHMAFATNVLQ